MTGSGTYTGGTTISSGTLQIGNGAATGSITGNVTDNGTLVFSRSDEQAYAGVISGSGGLTQAGYILRLSAAQTYTGPTQVNSGAFLVLPATVAQGVAASTVVTVLTGGTLDMSNQPQTFAGLAGGGTVYSYGATSSLLTLEVATGQNYTFSGSLGGSFAGFGLSKSGGGTETLSGANTYTGATTVSGGTLIVSGSIAGSTTAVSGTGSTLGGTGTVGAVNVGSGAILEGGDGSSASGALTSGGNVSLAAGAYIELTLGPGATHSSLARTGGNWSFNSNQAFVFNLAPGAAPGTYDNLITGLAGNEAGLASIGNWTIATPGVLGTFSYDAAGDVDLTLTAVPELATATLFAAGLPLLGLRRWRRRR